MQCMIGGYYYEHSSGKVETNKKRVKKKTEYKGTSSWKIVCLLKREEKGFILGGGTRRLYGMAEQEAIRPYGRSVGEGKSKKWVTGDG